MSWLCAFKDCKFVLVEGTNLEQCEHCMDIKMKVKTCVFGCGTFDNLTAHYLEKHPHINEIIRDVIENYNEKIKKRGEKVPGGIV